MKSVRHFVFGMALLHATMLHPQENSSVEFTVQNRSGLELYEWFEVEGALSTELSHHEANAIVEHALKSGDEQMIHHAVMGMSTHGAVATGWHELLIRRRLEGTVALRTFHEVPNLKGFLLKYYREGIVRDGVHIEPEPTEVHGVGWFTFPAWTTAPGILATNFPGDPEVHDFLFEAFSHGRHPSMVQWLSSGKFRTPEANAHRIECLGEEHDRFTRKLAAVALGEFQTPSGLKTLKQALHPDHPAAAEIAKSIMSYGEENVSPEVIEFARKTQHDERPWVQEAARTILKSNGAD